ncbi:hypothetical protein [Falsiroseomonas sp. E2-1-a20]|uniref:hypothetical protein n=1 Tax=Falsiroseomonas sp. E2-1-a20 TaxID=3239300 RepID=UPI003F2C855B
MGHSRVADRAGRPRAAEQGLDIGLAAWPGGQQDTPNAWDVAGGIPLVQAAGGQVLVRGESDWQEFPGFLEQGPEPADLRRWNRPCCSAPRRRSRRCRPRVEPAAAWGYALRLSLQGCPT